MNELSIYLEATNAIALDDDDIFTEGANIKSFKGYRDAKKKYKDAMKTYHKAFKASNYPLARKSLDEGISAVSSIQKEIEGTKDTLVSTIIGIAVPTITSLSYMLVPALLAIPTGIAITNSAKAVTGLSAKGDIGLSIPTALSTAGLYTATMVSAVVSEILTVINDVINLANRIKDRIHTGDDISTGDFNLFKNDLIAKTKKLKKILKDAKKRVDIAEKAEKDLDKKADISETDKAIDKAAAMESTILESYLDDKITSSEYKALMKYISSK